MATLDFAAHTLDFLEVTPPVKDDNGDIIAGQETWREDYCRCDVVPAGRANEKPFLDGQAETYTYSVYNLPRWCRDFKYGDKVRIHFFGNPDGEEFAVLGFHRYQLQCRLWV